MSFITTPSDPSAGDNPIAINSNTTGITPGDYELNAPVLGYSITLDETAPAGSEWVFTCANRTVELNSVSIAGATHTWTLPNGTTSASGESFVFNKGQTITVIRKTDTSLNYKVTVIGSGSTQTVSTEVSPLVGSFIFAKTTATKTAQNGWLAVTPGTVLGGATAYPVWAAMYPEYVSGANIVFPADVAGMFLRNIGGNAATQGTFQADRTARNGLGISDPLHSHGLPAASNGTFTGAGQAGSGFGTANAYSSSTAATGVTITTGDVETNPDNRAYQLFTLVDTFARSFSAIVPSNIVQNIATTSASNVPSVDAVRTRFNKAIWLRTNAGNPGAANYFDNSALPMTGTRAFVPFNSSGNNNFASGVGDFGAIQMNGTLPQVTIAVAGTYEITWSAGVRNATNATNYVFEIGRYNSANALQEVIGYQDMQVPATTLQNSLSAVFGIGIFAVGEKIGLMAYSAGGGTIYQPSLLIKAVAFI